jgi:hypothetical protein
MFLSGIQVSAVTTKLEDREMFSFGESPKLSRVVVNVWREEWRWDGNIKSRQNEGRRYVTRA